MKKMFDSWGSHVKKIPLQGLLCLFILCLSLPLHAQNEEGQREGGLGGVEEV